MQSKVTKMTFCGIGADLTGVSSMISPASSGVKALNELHPNTTSCLLCPVLTASPTADRKPGRSARRAWMPNSWSSTSRYRNSSALNAWFCSRLPPCPPQPDRSGTVRFWLPRPSQPAIASHGNAPTAPDPIAVAPLGVNRVMFQPQDFPDLVEQLQFGVGNDPLARHPCRRRFFPIFYLHFSVHSFIVKGYDI